MRPTSRKKNTKARPVWERGYRGHVYWLGKAKLGKVTHVERGSYRWEAAGRSGWAPELGKAKSAVEYAVLVADRQLDLFQ